MNRMNQLLEWNKEGYFPGPDEDENSFCQRVDESKKFYVNPSKYFERMGEKPIFSLKHPIPSYEWDWSKELLEELYDLSFKNPIGFYSKEKLQIIHGAQTWMISVPATLSLIQVHPKIHNKIYSWFYPLGEILAHELTHMVRNQHDHSKYEEVFAYATSAKVFRRILGPIIQYPYEFWIMAFLAVCSIFHPIGMTLFFTWISLGLFRLYKLHRTLNLCLRRLEKWTNSPKNGRSFVFRLSDREIEEISKLNLEQFKKYCLNKTGYRWEILKKAYLSAIF